MTLYEAELDPADAKAWGGTGKSKPQTKLQFLNLEPIAWDKLPPRPWAYGKFMLFGSAAVLGAVDGGGKGAIAVAMTIAMITGHPLLGEKVWRKGPVCIITYEDDLTEWHRRIAAACKFYGEMFPIDYEDILNNIRFIQGRKDRVSFAILGEAGRVFSDADEIIEMLTEFKAVMLIVDPFNHAHGMEDGNSNVLIAKVAAEMSRVASESKTAVLVLHHLRKGATGAPDDLMGATSLRATFRSCRILSRMTPEIAKSMNLTDNWRYIRIVGSKENYAPPPDKSTWFKLESVALDNGAEVYPEGDDIGVASTWSVRPTFEGMTRKTLANVFIQLASVTHGPSKQAKLTPWAGLPLKQIGNRTEAEAGRIIATWIENGVLVEDDYYPPTSKNKVKKLTLMWGKANPILDDLDSQDPPSD